MAAAPPWPVVQDESWQCAQTPTLPFLGFHEHTALRPIGEVTIQIPASPFFSLFLADDVKSEASARRGGGQSAVVFGKWSKHGAARERRVQYACDGVAVREAQRCTFVKDDGLVLEARCWAAANPGAARAASSEAELGTATGDADEWNLCERWVVAETKGYLRASTTVTAWASSEAGRRRWRAWASVLERRTYAAAVWAMASDSLFRSSTAPETGAAGPFSARAPPDRVQRAVLAAPPAVAARRKAEAERAATESAAAAGLGRLQPPWAVASPTVEADAPRRVVTVRAPGETYDVVVQTKDIGLQFSSVTNGCVVDGVDGYASADPPPSLGSRLVAVDGVRVGGLAFAGAAALLTREARPLRLAFSSPAPDSLADALLAADDAASPERAVAAALDKAKALRKRLDAFGEAFSKSDLTEDAPRRFWGTCRGAVRSLREAKLLKPLQHDDGVLKNLREKEEEEDDDEFWERCEAAVERRLMPSCVDALLDLSPGGDDDLAVTLGRLRFLRLEHLGVSAPGEADNDIGGEWAVAVEELRATDDAQSVSEVLDRVAQCCRFAAAAAEKVRNKGRRLEAYENVGADDVVPSLTYVAIRANPRRLATTLWFVESYASAAQLRGERGYAAASLRVAVDFAAHELRTAAPLEGLISDEAFKSGVRAAALVDEACAAARRADAKAFRLLLAAGVDVTAPDAIGATSPLIAAIEGQVCVDEALARVTDVEATLRDGRTALMASAAVGAASVCAVLLRKGADASRRDVKGRTAVMVARHRATRVLLSCGPPTDEAVVAAAAKADVDVLRALLAKGGSADATDANGCPALVAACAATAPACVAALLDSDADPNATHEGATALSWCVGLRGRATASTQAACAALLLNRGADRRDARAWCGDCGSSQLRAALETPETALRDGAVVLAAVEKNDEDAVAALLAQNWPADASTKEGDLALHVAADRGHVAAARALLDGGAAVDAPGGDGATPLMRATAAAQPDVVALLLNRGASVQLRDAAGRRASEVVLSADRKRLLALLASDPLKRPLVLLAARDDADGVRALLTRGADVNERSRCQTREAYHPELWTPLIAACAYDAKDAAKLLLAVPGIELDATNPYGLALCEIITRDLRQPPRHRADALARIEL